MSTLNQSNSIEAILLAAVRHTAAGDTDGPGGRANLDRIDPTTWRQLWSRAALLEIRPSLASLVLGPDTVCAAARADAIGFRLHNTARNALLARAQRDVAAALAAANVASIPLKGPLLSERAFGHAGARTIVDLDVLVPAAAAATAARALEKIGFRLPGGVAPGDLPLPSRRDIALAREDGVPLELHWKVKDTLFPLPLSAFWATRRHESWRGQPIERLDPTAEILYLLHHLTVHAFALKNLLDLQMAIAAHGETIDWQRLRDDANEARLGRALEVAIAAISEVLAVDPPSPARSLALGGRRSSLWLASCLAHASWYTGPLGLAVQCDGRLRAAFGRLIADPPSPRRPAPSRPVVLTGSCP